MKMYQPRDERYLTIAHARLSFSSPPRAQTCPPSSNSHQHRLCSGVLTGGVASGSSREHASALHNMLGPPVTVTFVYAVKVLSASKVLCVWTDHPLGVGTRPFSRY